MIVDAMSVYLRWKNQLKKYAGFMRFYFHIDADNNGPRPLIDACIGLNKILVETVSRLDEQAKWKLSISGCKEHKHSDGLE